MHRAVFLLRFLSAFAILTSLMLAPGCGDARTESSRTPCAVHDDCWSSTEASEQGRCGPNVACVEGGCIAWCPEQCTVVREDVNPCSEPGWICGEPLNSVDQGQFPTCRATEIGCESRDDCPKYRPDADGEWACTDGVCRFPDFEYPYENP